LATCEIGSLGTVTPLCGTGTLAVIGIATAIGGAILTYDSCVTGEWLSYVGGVVGAKTGFGVLLKDGAFSTAWGGIRSGWTATSGARSSVGSAARSTWDAVKFW
jgi:hypothetical protein